MSCSKNKCIIILSSKSSGSSPLQEYLTSITDAYHIFKTRHNENETLFWTKAASILELKQIKMIDSEVPIPKRKARQDLINLIKDNVEGFNIPKDDYALIFEGWRELCLAFRPVFIEKSPHHLCQWSALELIAEGSKILSDIEFFFIGLVRNPMDTIYSAWRRWRIYPEKSQIEWVIAYSNLIEFEKLFPEKFCLIKYEDLISKPDCLQPVFDFIGNSGNCAIVGNFFHSKSLSKWKSDKCFGFQPSQQVKELAYRYGYTDQEIENRPLKLWPAYRNITRLQYKVFSVPRRGLIKVLKRLKE